MARKKRPPTAEAFHLFGKALKREARSKKSLSRSLFGLGESTGKQLNINLQREEALRRARLKAKRQATKDKLRELQGK